MRTVLMVAEKPSLAQSIAKILSNGGCTSRKSNMNGACSVHEYNGKFNGDSVRYKVTSVCGHVMSLDFVGKYNNWDKVDPAELFGAPTQKKEATPSLHMTAFLEREARGIDYLVLWLDCDKEGENICFEVIDCVAHHLPRPSQQNIYRAHFSALTDTDIKRAMSNLGAPNRNEARSVDARQDLDLRIGCAFTRYQTKYFQGKYGDLDSTLISYGPCQTPTLGFCVERHDKIQSFKPEPYWVINLYVEDPTGKSTLLDWQRVRLFDKDVALLFVHLLKAGETARVTEVMASEKTKSRPQALNTVEMLRKASSGLGMGPQATMVVAERLYTQGYISYPRTETTHYPENFDLRGTLKLQSGHPVWGQYVRDLISHGMNKARKGSDAGDHPPITPMRCASEGDFSHDMWKLYEFITRHFIATVSCDCRYLETEVHFEVGSEQFHIRGKTLLDPGFTTILPWQALGADEKLPNFERGQMCRITEVVSQDFVKVTFSQKMIKLGSYFTFYQRETTIAQWTTLQIPLRGDPVKLVEKQTSPPDYLTESELITLMDKHGIGTDASIPVHINNICERNYVSIIGGRRLQPNPLGIILVHGYQKIDADLVLSTMRSAVEQQLNLIAAGKAQYEDVLKHALDIFHQKFKYFVENISGMDELFEVTFSPLAAIGKPLSRCGKCRRYMKFIQTKPTRLHCSTCDETYSLPQNGNIKLYKELKCPLDDFELILWTTGVKGKSFPVCPYCSNNPPFRDMRKGNGCNECSHPSCVHALPQTGVSECVECEPGILVLDQSSAPKWRLVCNRCNVVINIFDNAQKVTVTKETCPDCGSTILSVIFSKGKSPLASDAQEHSGCIFCDPVFKPLIEKHHAMALSTGKRGGRRGRGRGRGRKPRAKPS